MKSETKNTPVLRFPGFSCSWEFTSLSSVARIYDGTHQTPSYVKSGIPFVSVEDIEDIQGTTKFIRPDAFEKDFKVKPTKGDILMTRITAGVIGATAIIENDAPLGYYVSLALIRPNPGVNPHFLRYSIGSPSFKRELHKRIIHVAFPKKINLGEIGECRQYVPPNEEQHKIATFLSAVDEKIGQLARKKELLLKYKQSLMQQIFDQKIRFKDDDGQDFADWKEMRFGEVFSFLPTNSFSREDLNYLDGEVRNIHYGDIHTKFRPLLNMYDEEVPFINKEISLARIPEANYLRTGDLVFADASEDYADVGKCIEIGSTNGQRVLSGLHTLLARPKVNEFANGFGIYLMKSWPVRRQIMREAQGTKVLGISNGRLAKIRLTLPSIAEQAKIARFISTIGKKIEMANQQLEVTRTFKEGLLQQMFV